MSTIGITGASGQLGRLTIGDLIERGVAPADLIAITRTPDRLGELTARGVDVRRGDFSDPGSLPDAFAGVDRLLLISTDTPGVRPAQHRAAIAAAVAAGVGHIAYTSGPNPVEDNPVIVMSDHRLTEEALQASGAAWTILRNGLYAEFEVPSFQQAIASGNLIVNTGDGATAYVAREDCAAAAAGALLGDGHARRIYDITGPELVTAAQKATWAGELSDRPVGVVNVDDAAFTAGLAAAGLPEPVPAVLASFGKAIREGYLDQLTDAVLQLAGRPPRTLRDVVAATVQNVERIR